MAFSRFFLPIALFFLIRGQAEWTTILECSESATKSPVFKKIYTTAQIKTMAAKATQIKITPTTGDDPKYTLTSKPNTAAIQNLRGGREISYIQGPPAKRWTDWAHLKYTDKNDWKGENTALNRLDQVRGLGQQSNSIDGAHANVWYTGRCNKDGIQIFQNYWMCQQPKMADAGYTSGKINACRWSTMDPNSGKNGISIMLNTAGPPTPPPQPFPKCNVMQVGCTCLGDPHCTTFDGVTVDYQGKCRYDLITGCKGVNLPFEVTADFSSCGPGVTCLRKVHVKLLTGQNRGTLTVNVEKKPNEISSDGLTVKQVGKSELKNGAWIEIKSASADKKQEIGIRFENGISRAAAGLTDLTLRTDAYDFAAMYLGACWSKQTCGLCGKFDGNKDNDLTFRNGTLSPITPGDVEFRRWTAKTMDGTAKWGDSWLSPDQDPAKKKECPQPPVLPCNGQGSDKYNKIQSACEKVEKQYNDCSIDWKTWRQMCIFDSCATCKTRQISSVQDGLQCLETSNRTVEQSCTEKPPPAALNVQLPTPRPTPKPTCGCPKILKRVCGADGRTYDNDCLAKCQKVEIQCSGSCPCTAKPTDKPTNKPTTRKPTADPTTQEPTNKPTNKPTTKQPTADPTNKPTTEKPTEKPSEKPTEKLTDKPTTTTKKPATPKPTEPKTNKPTEKPTTKQPTEPQTPEPTAQEPTKKPTTKPTFRPTTQPTECKPGMEIDCDANPYQLKCLLRQICTEPFCETDGPETLTPEFLKGKKDLFEKQCTSTCADILPRPKLIFSKDSAIDCSVSGGKEQIVEIKGQKRAVKEGEYVVFGKDLGKEEFQYVDLKNTAEGFPDVNGDFTLFVRFAIDKERTPDHKYLPVVTKQANGKVDWGIFVKTDKPKGKLEIIFRSKMNFEIAMSGIIDIRFDIISVAVTLNNDPANRLLRLYENGRLLSQERLSAVPGIGQAETQNIKIGLNPTKTDQIGQCFARTFYGYVMSFYVYDKALTEIDIFTTQTCLFRQEYISITNPHDMNFKSAKEICKAKGYELARVTNEVSNIHALWACKDIDPIDCWLSEKMKNYTNYQGGEYEKEWCPVLLIENKAGKWVKRPCNMSQGVICGGYKNPCNTMAPTKKPTPLPTMSPTAQTGVPTPSPVPSPTKNPTTSPSLQPSTNPTRSPTSPCKPPSICITMRNRYVTKKKVSYKYIKWNTNGYIETVEKQLERLFVDEYCKNKSMELTSDAPPTSEFELEYNSKDKSLDLTGSVSGKIIHTNSLNQNGFTFEVVLSLNKNGPKEKYMSVLSQESGVGVTKGWSFWINDVNGIGMVRLNYGGQELEGGLGKDVNIYEPMEIIVSYTCVTNMFELYVNGKQIALAALTELKSSCFNSEKVEIKVGGASAAYRFGNCWDILQGKIYSIHFWASYMKEANIRKCVRLDREGKVITSSTTANVDAVDAVEGKEFESGNGKRLVMIGVLVSLLVCALCVVGGVWMKRKKSEKYLRIQEGDVRQVKVVTETTPLKM